MASPSLRENFEATVEIYYTFIKHMKAENPQLNVSDVSFARGKAGKNSVNTSGKAGAKIPQLPLGDDSSPWVR
jgi:hypothetical protein